MRELLLKAATVCLIVYCAVGALLLTVGSAKLISSPWENSYPESPSIYGAVLAAQTGHLYFSPSEAPYTLQPYGPAYYAVNAAIAWASNLDVDLIATRSRLLVFACFLLNGVLVALIARKLGFSTGSGVLAALMLLGQPDFYPNNASVRPDMLYLAGMLLCLLATLGARRDEVYALSGVLAGTALMVKQTAIAAPIAIVAVLLLRRKYRQSLWFVFGVSLPVALTMGYLVWRREPFYENMASIGYGVWSVANGATWTAGYFIDILIVIPLAIGAIGFTRAMRAGEDPQMISVFALANWCVALATIPQLGGNVNYFQPGLAGCALLLPFAMRVTRERARPTVVVAGICVLLLWATWGGWGRMANAFQQPVQRHENLYASLGPFRILSDRTYFNLHGRDPQLLDPLLNHSLELTKHWDPSVIVGNLNRGDYDLIILACTGREAVCEWRGVAYFGAPIIDAINKNYEVLCSTLGPRVLKPRVREVSATPEMLGSVLGQRCGTAMRGRTPGLRFAEGTR